MNGGGTSYAVLELSHYPYVTRDAVSPFQLFANSFWLRVCKHGFPLETIARHWSPDNTVLNFVMAMIRIACCGSVVGVEFLFNTRGYSYYESTVGYHSIGFYDCKTRVRPSVLTGKGFAVFTPRLRRNRNGLPGKINSYAAQFRGGRHRWRSPSCSWLSRLSPRYRN